MIKLKESLVIDIDSLDIGKAYKVSKFNAQESRECLLLEKTKLLLTFIYVEGKCINKVFVTLDDILNNEILIDTILNF